MTTPSTERPLIVQQAVVEQSLFAELRSSALLFGMAIGVSVGIVAGAQALLRLAG